MLAIKHGPAHDLTLRCKTCHHYALNGLFIGHGQCAGHAQAYRTYISIGLIVMT